MQQADGELQWHVPLFEITQKDWKKIQKYMEGGPVYLKVSTDDLQFSGSIDVDLWYSSTLDLGLKLSDELSALSYSFKNNHGTKPLFTPRIATFECRNCSETFLQENCMSDGLYCPYTPKFFDEYKLQNSEFQFSGREILLQALREKCLHDLISDKYDDEGTVYWTFFKYLDECFVENGPKVKSLSECFDWSTVVIDGNEEVKAINKCVANSFEVSGDYDTDNYILAADKAWAISLSLQYHPSITINGVAHSGDISGQDLAFAICAAFEERPDECDLSWAIKTYEQGVLTDFQDLKMPE